MYMNRVNMIKDVWQRLESEATEGLFKRALEIPSCLKTFCTFRSPEKFFGIAFSFHQDIKLDISIFHNLSELNVTLFKDTSFPNSNLLLVQLNNRERRANDIFAFICANIVSSILNIESEKESVRMVMTQMKKWKELFSKKKNHLLSTQEQQGLFGELFFLIKLLHTSIDKAAAIEFWVGSDMAPQDFQSDMWAVEVKTVTTNNQSGISINGELQLDESDIEKLFLYNLVVEVLQKEGQTLPEIITAIRQLLEEENHAFETFETKLMLSNYFDIDKDYYQENHYHIRKELYFQIKDEFPRIKKNDLRMGVSEVKYTITLTYSSDNMVTEKKVINTIMSYERTN